MGLTRTTATTPIPATAIATMAAVAAIVVSCIAESPETPVNGHAVDFGTYTEQFQTRSEVKRAIPDGGSMGVYAYLHDNSTWLTASEHTPNFMWNQQATYHADGNSFIYSPLKYWPNEENDKVSFIAYYPYSAETPGSPESPAYPYNATGLKTLLGNADNGLPSFEFTVKDNAAEQVDLLISDLITDLPYHRADENAPGTPFNNLSVYDHVKFVFRHALAKIEFRVIADADIRRDIVGFKVNSLTISIRHTQGKLEAMGTTYSWSLPAPGDPNYPSALHIYTCKTYEPYLLMPQELKDDAMFYINYSITFKGYDTTYANDGTTLVNQYTYSNSATLKLNTFKMAETGTELTEWLPNHHYVYNIHLRANRIEFTGEVVDWGDKITPTDIPGINDVSVEER